MNFNDYLSYKFRRLSFAAAIAVATMHCTQMMGHYDATPWSEGVRAIITGPITNWAVSFFFIVSGYWFGIKRVVDWLAFYRKKAQTILIPYLLFALLISVLSLPIIMLLNHQTGSCVLNRTFLSGANLWLIIDGLFGITHDPVNAGHLWYIRYLIVLFLLAPFWQFICDKSQVLLAFISLYLLLGLPLGFTYDPRVGFFFGGMLLSRGAWISLRCSQCWLVVAIGFVFVVLSALSIFAPFSYVDRVLQLATIIFIWLIYDHIDFSGTPRPFVSLSFWVYCVHIIILAYIIGTVHVLFGRSAVVTICAIPLITATGVLTSLAFHWLLLRTVPSFVRMLMGGRG